MPTADDGSDKMDTPALTEARCVLSRDSGQEFHL